MNLSLNDLNTMLFRSTGCEAAHNGVEEEREEHFGVVRRAAARHAGRHDRVQQGGRRGDRNQSTKTLRARQKRTNALDTSDRHTLKVQFTGLLYSDYLLNPVMLKIPRKESPSTGLKILSGPCGADFQRM